MTKNYDNPLDQMKAISWQLKRIADALESRDESMIEDKPKSMSDTFGMRPHTPSVFGKIRAQPDSTALRSFLGNLEKNTS